MLNISSQMSAQMQLSLLNKEGLDLHTGLTSAYSSKSTNCQWIEKKQEFEKEQEASVTTQCEEDKDVNAKVLQNKNRNGIKRVYECPVCLKRFGAPSKLKRHCLIHTDQRPFQCSICFRAFRERSHLKAHFRTHTNPSSPDAVTTAGKRIFPVSKSSDRMCTLELKKKSGYQCEICLKKFSFPSKLTRHLFVHFDGKPYTCTICRKSFKQAYYLHKHLKVHTGKRNGNSRLCSVQQKHGAKSPKPGALERTNNCRPDGGNVCLPQILDSLETKKHEKSECRSKLNQNVQLIESNSSTLEIKSSDTLKNAEVQITASSPIDLKHTHKGVNQCSICLKNFPYPSKLARHILSHTDIRPFKCHVCLKSFQFRWHLQCHVRIHKKESQNITADHLERDHTVSFSNAAKSEEQDVQISSQDGAEDSATVHQDQNMVKKNMMNQKMSGDCTDSGVYLQVSLLNVGRLDLPSEQSSAYSPKPSEDQWMEENQESAKEKEGSVTTQSKDKDVNVKVLQSKNSNGNKRVYDCPVCHKRFGAPSKLKRHRLIHTNQRPFQCSICCRAFRERSHLKVHIRTHTNPVKRGTRSLHGYKDNSVPCNRTSKSKLKPFPKNRTAQNDTCSTNKQKIAATDFIETNAGTMGVKVTKGHWCPLCLKCFKAPSKLKRHILIHTGQRPFKCSVCPKTFREKSHLKVHKCTEDFRLKFNSILSDQQVKQNTVQHNANEGVVSTANDDSNDIQGRCSSPDAVTTAEKRIFPVSKSSDRMRTLELKKKSGYQCEICLKKFSFPSKLTRHMFVHFDGKPYTCTICRKSFKQAYYLHKHLKVHAGKRNGNSRLCRVQQKHGAKSPKPGALERTNNCRPDGGNVCLPQILDSLETKKHEKPECRSKLNQNVTLIESNSSTIEIKSSDTLKNAEVQITASSPIDLKHTHKGVNQCSICLKNFPYPSKLARHILSHTDIRPFKCHVCLKSFRYRWHLQCHVRIHKKESQNIIAGHLEQDCTVSFSNVAKSEEQDVQISSQDRAEDSAKVHKDQHMVMESQKMSGDCSDSGVYLQDYLPNKEGLDLHAGQSSAYSSEPAEGQWMEEVQESEEEQEAIVTTQNEVKNVNAKVLQSKNSNVNKRIHECPVCHKWFCAPSKLKRHCLIHTNQRPFQCSICCRAFRERSHLKVHIRTHTNPVKRRTRSLHGYKDNSVPCNRTSKLKPSPKQPTAQDDNKSTDKEKLTVHQDQNMVTENMASQKISGYCNDSGVYLQDSLLNKEGWDRHTEQSSAYSSKPSEDQWMEEIQETDEEQEASVTAQNEVKNVNVNVLQNKNSNGNKRVYDCPVCHKRFGAPSKLKRHCLIHTNQRPFQCSICCRAFRERSHLKVHIRTHTNPGKGGWTRSLHGYKDNSVPCNRTSKSKLNPSPKYLTVQNNANSTEKQQSTVHQDENMVTENMASQVISGDCSESDVYLQDSLLNKEGLDLHAGQSSAYSSNPSEDQWMEEVQEASVTTQTEDNDVNSNVWQSKNSNGSKRVHECPVCHKRFGAPSKLKRHCLIHTNQRPFQCSICCRAFRERSHLKVHFRTHNIPEKRRTPSHQSYRDNSVPCNRASRLKPSPKQPTAQDGTKSTDKEKSTVHQDKNTVIENMVSQVISGDCSESDVYLQDSLPNKKGLDLHTGQSSAYFSKPSEDQWMEENLETEEKQESSLATQSEDNDVNVKLLQSKNSDGNNRVYDCPVCHKRFGAPSELKRHYLIHTNQRPFQCSICCRAFRERSHLKVHFRTHTNPVKRGTPSHQSYRDNSVPCNRASKSRLKPSPKYLTAHNDTTSTNKQKSTVQQDQNVLTEDMLSQKKSGGCSDSGAYLSKSTSPLENVENKVVFWCNNKSVWGLTHKPDILLDGKKASDIVPFGRVSDCPPKTDSSLRHCAPESRTEEKWAHHMDDIEDCVFVDSDTVVTQCVPDSYEPSSCQYQQKPDVPRLPEVVVELEDFEDPGECFIKPPRDLPFCPDCNQSFRTIRNLYAHNCANRYPEGEMKKSHQCDICFKFFNAPSKLKRHYVTHTGQRPFQCTQCQKSFTQSHHLKTHMLSHR